MTRAPAFSRMVLLSLVALVAACDDGNVGGGRDGGLAADAGPGGDGAPGDGGLAGPDATPADAGPPAMSISEIIPAAASRLVDTPLTIVGFALADGATATLSSCDTSTVYTLTPVTVAADGTSATSALPADPTREQGLYTVTVTNPDGHSDRLECAFRILAQAPPTVTEVVPATAFAGVPGDGVSSDQLVTITGTGFRSTPAVRWLSTGGSASYDALLVGFVSDTQITAIVPSETLHMPAGSYHVLVVNPDRLAAEWTVPDGAGGSTPGLFSITAVPPPRIGDVEPPRVENGTCTSTAISISGSGFVAGASVWYIVPAGTTCAGSSVDANGHTLCPMAIDALTADSITTHFSTCPGTGPWPLAVVNPDGQSDAFFSVQVTPSSDGHLNTGAFGVLASALVTPRWKHGAAFGFDVFGSAHIYAVGGQDAAGAVVGTTEIAELDVFGTPGPFALARQFLSAASPRALETLDVPRQGLTVVRVGRDLYALGGATSATDVAATVPASGVVERARILGYDEMPGVHLPVGLGGTGLPEGAWYYQVSAVGPWGESLASREVLVAAAAGRNKVCWSAPAAAGATGFNIYRSLASDGRAGTATLLATQVAGPCFVDDGLGALAPAPGNLRGTVAIGSGLAAGTHEYRVAAVVGVNGTPTETVAGYASAAELTSADLGSGHGALQLSWDAVPGALEYRLYRRDPATGGFARLTTGTLTATNFLDDGVGFASPVRPAREGVRPLPAGSLSLWRQDVPELNHVREGLDGIAVAMDPALSGGLVARLVVVGGRTANNGGYLRTAESLGIHDDGSVDPAWFDEAAQLTNPRVYYALVTTQGRDETPFPPPPEEQPCGDLDGDGFVDCACAPAGAAADCNDVDPTIHPGATEICDDGIDQDCDQGCGGTDLSCTCTTDVDHDTHLAPSCGGDDCCDTGDEAALGCSAATAAGIHPGAVDICGNGIDEDCDGVDAACSCATDADGDGHASLACGGDDCCDTAAGTSLGCTDATAASIHPGAFDVCSDGIDQDCDGSEPVCKSAAAAPRTADKVLASEPVYAIAVFGDDVFAASSNAGRSDEEACLVDAVTGHLSCTQWQTQPTDAPQASFGVDALLYFDYLYPFYGVSRETITASGSSRTFVNSAITRFPVLDPASATGNVILGGRQSASTTFAIKRTHYQMLRLMSYVYVLGGWAEAHLDAGGLAVPEGPTGTIERHDQ